MKQCYVCKRKKPYTEFNKDASNKRDGLVGRCRPCAKSKWQRYYANAKNANKHKARMIVVINIRRRNNRIKLREFLLTHPCVDCGEEDFIVLQFDHVIGKKKNSVSELVNRAYSWDTVKEEIEKCEVRCANCHTRKTAKSFDWYANIKGL